MHIKSEQDSKFEIRTLTIDIETRKLAINKSFVLRDECSQYVAGIFSTHQKENILLLGYSEQQKGNITKTTVVHQNIQAIICMLEEKYRSMVQELLSHREIVAMIRNKRIPPGLLSEESLQQGYQYRMNTRKMESFAFEESIEIPNSQK